MRRGKKATDEFGRCAMCGRLLKSSSTGAWITYRFFSGSIGQLCKTCASHYEHHPWRAATNCELCKVERWYATFSACLILARRAWLAIRRALGRKDGVWGNVRGLLNR